MMRKQKRYIAAASFLALMLYFGPNLLQDIHRVYGHDHQHFPRTIGTQIYTYSTQCPVCVFEFTSVDDIAQYKENTVVRDCFSLIETEIEFRDLRANNFNFRSRAPPD
jgi:hypothetical protein